MIKHNRRSPTFWGFLRTSLGRLSLLWHLGHQTWISRFLTKLPCSSTFCSSWSLFRPCCMSVGSPSGLLLCNWRSLSWSLGAGTVPCQWSRHFCFSKSWCWGWRSTGSWWRAGFPLCRQSWTWWCREGSAGIWDRRSSWSEGCRSRRIQSW